MKINGLRINTGDGVKPRHQPPTYECKFLGQAEEGFFTYDLYSYMVEGVIVFMVKYGEENFKTRIAAIGTVDETEHKEPLAIAKQMYISENS